MSQPSNPSNGGQQPHASPASMFSFDKLDGVATYHNWKFQMRMALVMEGLWACIESSETGGSADHKALARICLAIKSNCIQYVRDAKNAKDAWEKLRDAFEDKGLYRRVVLLRKLHRSDYEQYSSMGDYIEGIMMLVQQLADIGRIIEDNEVAEILLSGLPQEFDVLVSALETANLSGTLTSEAVRSRLLQEEFRKLTKEKSNGGQVFLAKKKSSVICHYCHKPGHIKSKCFKLKNDQNRKGSDSDKRLADTLLVSAISLLTVYGSEDWIVDSGCTSHMCCVKDLFRDIDTSYNSQVRVANGESLRCLGLGKVSLNIKNNDQKCLSKVMFVPNLTTNLISVSQLTKSGFRVIFDKDTCQIFDQKGHSFAVASCCAGIFKLDVECLSKSFAISDESNNVLATTNVLLEQDAQSALASGFVVPLEIWHRRLGHLSWRGMYAVRSLADGVDFQDNYNGELKNCIPCIEGKLAVHSFPKGQAKRAQHLLELIHSDVCGPMSETSWGGARYLVTFTDDFSRKTHGYLVTYKSEVLSCFIKYKRLVENQTGKTIKCLRSDNGGEYCNIKFDKFLSDEGLVHQTSIPFSPQQNGVSERLNRTLVEKARCMLSDARLDRRYWGEAVTTAIYLKNRSPTAALSGGIPEQLWTGSKVDLSHLRVFGSRAYSLIPEHRRMYFCRLL